ncbi:MAG TPA: DUF1697 domain-containing protein [Anaerolineales bacterium]|nr:DUF1697 domain-containing protein [Anaerolineales bacterium]
MSAYLLLLRGINVGGKNKVPMAALRKALEDLGFSDVATFIASGNVILRSDKRADWIKVQVEQALPRSFRLHSELVKVLVLTRKQLQAVIDKKPRGFGEQPDKYHSDAIFLIDVPTAEAMRAFNPREGVDQVWAGHGMVYSQRLSAQRTRSRLNKIMGSPVYKSMTIRNWNTTTTLLEMLNRTDGKERRKKA